MAAPDQIKITHQRPMTTSFTICAALDAFQRAANRGTAVHLSPELVQELRDALQAKPEGPATPPAPEPGDVGELVAANGVFKGSHGIEGLLNANAFWEQHPYGTRLYYGDGIADYLHRGVLRSAATLLQQQESELAALREERFVAGQNRINQLWVDALDPSTQVPLSAPQIKKLRKVLDDHCDQGPPNGTMWKSQELEELMWAVEGWVSAATPPPAPQVGDVQPPHPTFLDAIRLAQGCHDYSGGHSGQQGEAFQDGVGTVVAVLKKAAVRPWDPQTMAVFAIGSAPQVGEAQP